MPSMHTTEQRAERLQQMQDRDLEWFKKRVLRVVEWQLSAEELEQMPLVELAERLELQQYQRLRKAFREKQRRTRPGYHCASSQLVAACRAHNLKTTDVVTATAQRLSDPAFRKMLLGGADYSQPPNGGS